MNRRIWINWLLLVTPLLYGWLASRLMWVGPPLIIGLVFAIYWFWVGSYFAGYPGRRWKTFIWGNSLWALSFALLLWQFVLTSSADRSLLLAMISQLYMFPFVGLGITIYRWFSTTLHGTHMMIMTYVIMFAIFSLGFVWGQHKRRV